MLLLSDGPERDLLFNKLKRLGVVYMPYKVRGHQMISDLAWPWITGYRQPSFQSDWWESVDIEAHPEHRPVAVGT